MNRLVKTKPNSRSSHVYKLDNLKGEQKEEKEEKNKEEEKYNEEKEVKEEEK